MQNLTPGACCGWSQRNCGDRIRFVHLIRRDDTVDARAVQWYSLPGTLAAAAHMQAGVDGFAPEAGVQKPATLASNMHVAAHKPAQTPVFLRSLLRARAKKRIR
jgi:hypothetical protein